MDSRMFAVNDKLLLKAQSLLCKHNNIYWIVGGACSGKSTVCRHLSQKFKIELYDMDSHVFGEYMEHYSSERHPATLEWFGKPKAVEWVLSLSWPEFDSLNEATNVEYLDIFANNISRMHSGKPLLVDGGLAHPKLLIGAIPTSRIVCVSRPERDCIRSWETDKQRIEMKETITGAADDQAAWDKFLLYDRLLTETLIRECKSHHIKILEISETSTVETVANEIMAYFRMSA